MDAVLKHWVALETLVMPNTTDLRPVNEVLKRVYGKPMAEIQATFGVGRVFGLRAQIVHHGAIVPIDERLLRYLEALYADLLLESFWSGSGERVPAGAATAPASRTTKISIPHS